MSLNQFRPFHVDPMPYTPIIYGQLLRQYNKDLIDALSWNLKNKLEDLCDDVTIAIPGSDAREENWGSRTEIMFVQGNSCCDEDFKLIKKYVLETESSSYIEEDVEIKKVDLIEDSIYSRFKDGQERLWSPFRTLDAISIFGNPLPLNQVKKNLATLVYESPKKILDPIKDRIRNHRQVTQTGIQRYKGEEIRHYDLEKGEAIYDPDKRLWSFKQGPLRLLQYSLARDTILLLKEGKVESEDILSLPSNIVWKLNAIQHNGKLYLDDTELLDVQESYLFFLRLYHLSQKAYVSEGISTVPFVKNNNELKEAKERLEFLISKCSKPLIKY